VKLVDSLLEAISRLEGDALIMHVGEKPYVVTTSASMYAYRGPLAWGHVELSSRVLTTDAVLGMLEQLLPIEERKALEEYGAVEYALPERDPLADRFTVVAARGGDDVWLEVRRTPAVAEASAEEAAPPVAEPEPVPQPLEQQEPEEEEIAASAPTVDTPPVSHTVDLPAPSTEDLDAPFELVEDEAQIVPTHAEVDALLTAAAAALLPAPEAQVESPAHDPPVAVDESNEAIEAVSPTPPEMTIAAETALPEPAAIAPPDVEAPAPTPIEDARPAVVVPLSRSPIAAEPTPDVRPSSGSPLERVLRIAAARGAATVYVVAHSKPVIRVDGEISVLEGEPALTAQEVERLVMDLAPARGRDMVPAGEWMAEVPDVGRVRCVTFRDHRGPGVIFRMIPPRAISAEQLGISPEVQALCAQPDGLVLVTGARASGKSTLLSAFVDLINRTRSDHVITIESQIGFVHESRRSFVSQREVRGDSDAAAAAVRSAFREDPDVLVIEDMRTPEIVAAALEAAESGRLVFGSLSAPATRAAVDRLIEMFPADRRAQAQTSLAGALRGVVAQALLRKVRGGRVAAREILLNTPAVARLILEGKTFQLPVALDSGRRHGMLPLADSLASLVRDGTVHAAEAYRKAPDREALLAALRRDGVDTSFAERLA
jgi:twitching motility protein PilT